jgi:putative endonuclease
MHLTDDPLSRQSAPPVGGWFVYLVRTRTGSLYTGIATDVERRLREHCQAFSRAAKYLRSRGPLRLAYRALVGDRALALRVEHRLKRLAKHRKEQIVASQPEGGRLLELLALNGAL